jgi:pimeloyl-ACP methyl ester carboxylesterase
MSATEVHSPSRDAAAGTADMNGMSQYTAPTRTIDAPNGTTYAYRRFGRKGAIPVIFLQHFRGNLDNWDPALVDDIAAGREVILADNSGVGLSTDSTPQSVKGLARDVLAFVDALGLTEIDLFGFSLGGFVAQETVLLRPRLVRRLILAGTGPEAGADSTPGARTSPRTPIRTSRAPRMSSTWNSPRPRQARPRRRSASHGSSPGNRTAITSRPWPCATRRHKPSPTGASPT